MGKGEKTMTKELKEYPVDCDYCEVAKELKGKWVSKTGMTFSLYQCPECKDIDVYMADEPLSDMDKICPRCGSENLTQVSINEPEYQGYTCKDCKLFFKVCLSVFPDKTTTP